MEGKLNLYFKDLEDKIERSYEREQCDEAELKNLIELIKLDDNNDFYKAFTNRISNLIKSKEKKIFLILNCKRIQIYWIIFIIIWIIT